MSWKRGQGMRLDKKYMHLYAVTDRAWTGEKTLYEQINEALKNGVTCVQLREKNLDEISFIEEAKKKLKSVLHQGESYDIKIELFLKGGNTVILEMENEQYAEYDFEQLKRIFESKKCIAE